MNRVTGMEGNSGFYTLSALEVEEIGFAISTYIAQRVLVAVALLLG